jgi:hypothetical protein
MQQLNANFFWDEIRQVSALGNDQQDLDITKLKPLIDSASYLIRQIEICDHELYKLNHLPKIHRERMTEEISDWNRQRSQYQESLKQVISKL